MLRETGQRQLTLDGDAVPVYDYELPEYDDGDRAGSDSRTLEEFTDE